jgi:2,3-bisphosphoglycerate-independent phosphoglycerate mutase
MLAGFNSINVPEFDDYNEWLDFIFENIDSALSEYDFVYAHIKSADEAAHDKDPELKRKIIEAIDAKLEPLRNFDGTIVLTCDHITSSESGNHEYGPVPVLVYGKKKSAAKITKAFDEESVKKGSLGRMDGRGLMRYIFGK